MLQIDKLLLKFSQNRISQMVVITHIDIYLCLDTSIRMDPKLKAESQYVVKNVSSGDIIPCLLDTGSRLSIIP